MNWGTKYEVTAPDKNALVHSYVAVDSILYVYYTLRDSGMTKIIQQRVSLNPYVLHPPVTLLRFDKSVKEILNLIVSDDLHQHLFRCGPDFSHLGFYVFDCRSHKVRDLGQINIDQELNLETEHAQILTDAGDYNLIFSKPYRRGIGQFKFFSGANGLSSPTEFKLTDPLTEVRLIHSLASNHLFLVGLYENKTEDEQLGLAFIDLTRTDPESSIIRIPFSDSILSAFYAEKKSENRGLSDLVFKNVLMHKDGSMTLIYEQERKVYRSNMPGRNVFMPESTSIDYFLDNVVIIHIKANMTPGWQRVLLKKQQSYDDEAAYSSFFLHKNPSMLRFLYNDEIRRSNTISEFWLTPLGNTGRKVLINTDHSDLNLQIRNGAQINAGTTIIPSIDKNKLRLMKISFY